MSDNITLGPDARFPIERRRTTVKQSPTLGIDSSKAYMRREADQVRMRIQHWMELADAALNSKQPAFKRHRSH
jgi:hypothetical protein